MPAEVEDDAARRAWIRLQQSPSLDTWEEAVRKVPKQDLAQIFEAARFNVDFQMRVADRLDAKVRNLAAIVAAFAAAVQTFALRDLVLLAPGHEWVVATALVAAGAVFAAFVACWWATLLQTDQEIVPEVHLRPRIYDLLKHPDDRRPALLVINDHVNVAIARRRTNIARQERTVWAQRACGLAISLVAVELVTALIVVL